MTDAAFDFVCNSEYEDDHYISDGEAAELEFEEEQERKSLRSWEDKFADDVGVKRFGEI